VQLAAAAFLLGLAFGTAGTVLFSANMVDQLYLEQERMLSELSEAENRIAMLEQSLTERRTRVVKSVSVQLDAGDQRLTLKLAGHAHQLVEGLVGREVSAIDPDTLAAVFDKRILAVEEGQFELSMKHLIISDTVTIKLSVRPVGAQ